MIKKVLVLSFLAFAVALPPLFSQTESLENAIRNFRYREAVGLLDEQPQTHGNLLLKAECFEKLYDYASAAAIYENLLAENPDDLSTTIALAECAGQMGDSEKSLRYWAEAIRISPDNLFLLTQKTLAHYRADDWVGTIATSEEAFKTDSVPMLLRLAGDARMSLNEGTGLLFYMEALRRNPADNLSVSRLANFYYSAHLYDEAIAVTDTFLTNINPRHKSVGRLNGLAHYASKNYDKAIDRLKINIESGDSSYTTCYTLGVCYYATDRYPDAAEWLGKAYAKDDNPNVNLLYYYGSSLCQVSEQKKGIDILLQGVKKIEEMGALMFNYDLSLANAHLQLKNWDTAVNYFKDGYKQKPDQPALLYNIAHAYDTAKKTKNAIDYYERFLKTKPKDVVIDDSPVDAGELKNIPVRILYYKLAFARIKELKDWLKSSGNSK